MKENAEKYKARSIHYLENAHTFMKAGNDGKAGELLWGSMAETLKAIAASKGIQLRTHWDINDHARQLAKELGDKSIYDSYGHAGYLHTNFYEAGLRLEGIYIFADDITRAVRKLSELISA